MSGEAPATPGGSVSLFHILPRAAWEAARAAGVYRPDSLAREGFIHLSSAAQLAGTARRFFAGQADLLVLEVDPSACDAPLEWEDPGEGQRFPHLYGPLALCAVRAVHALRPDGGLERAPAGA